MARHDPENAAAEIFPRPLRIGARSAAASPRSADRFAVIAARACTRIAEPSPGEADRSSRNAVDENVLTDPALADRVGQWHAPRFGIHAVERSGNAGCPKASLAERIPADSLLLPWFQGCAGLSDSGAPSRDFQG
jgi:hypothetical protein